LEALSRGAASATFVEADRKAAAVIRRNIATLGASNTTVHASSVERFLAQASEGFDLVFLDPPYDLPTTQVSALVGSLPPGGLVVVERSSRDPFTWPQTRSGLRERRYGETALWYGR
jgi:16S rRNA (guanine966-N2)-methyltransferase